jgi:glutamyl/glutaminyl-tRNA synthetase
VEWQLFKKLFTAIGLDWDEGPDKDVALGLIFNRKIGYSITSRFRLVANGKAYYCFCSKERLSDIKNSSWLIKNRLTMIAIVEIFL